MKLRGAILGAGNIALRGHLPQWTGDARLRETAEIVAVADLSPANRDAALVLLPHARAYVRAEDALADEGLDFCDICTPPFTHRALIEAAAARGVHVLCEKPLAHTLDDALAIARAVRRAGIVFRPCHQYHDAPQWRAVKRLLPRIGRVYMADYRVHRLAANEGNPHWDPGWRTDPSRAGGGILVDHGAHIFYQLRAVMGEPTTVQATVRRLLHRGYETEDTAFVTLDFPEGVAQVSLTWAARQREIAFRFVGEDGEITGDEERVTVRAETTESIELASGMSANSSHAEWYTPLMREFTGRAQAGVPDTESLDEALYVTRVIARAYESFQRGRALPLIGTVEAERTPSLETIAAPSSDLPVRATGRSGMERVLRGAAYAVLLAAFVWVFRDVHWLAVTAAVGAAVPLWISLATGVNLMALVFQAARWRALLRPLSRAATLAGSFKAMMVGFTVSMVVPARAGELARAHFLGRRAGLSRATVLGSIVLDHMVNAAGLLAGLAVLPFFIVLPGWMRAGGWIALGLLTAAVTVVALMRPAQAELVSGSESLPVRTILRLLARLQHGLTGARNPRALGKSFGASMLAWGLEVGVVQLSLRAVGLRLPLSAACLVLAGVNLALMFPVATPGNVGTVELGAALALLEFGVPKEGALAFSICYRLLQMVPIALLGVTFASRESGRWAFWRPARASGRG